MITEGTFTVSGFTGVPVEVPDPVQTALGVGVATMEKRYYGAVEGRSNTLFTSAFDPERGIGTYVALESFEGSLDGRSGTFNFVHVASTSGTDRSGEFFAIVAGSGTGSWRASPAAGRSWSTRTGRTGCGSTTRSAERATGSTSRAAQPSRRRLAGSPPGACSARDRRGPRRRWSARSPNAREPVPGAMRERQVLADDERLEREVLEKV